MILCDSEIKAALKYGALIIDPEPAPEQISTSSVDLRLGREFRRWKRAAPGTVLTLDPGSPGFSFSTVAKDFTEPLTLDGDGAVTIQPQELVLGITLERVDLPRQSRLAARVEGKSSLGRLGLGVHVTAPTIHAGFTGLITLEIANHNSLPIKLRSGMKVCQLIIEQVFGTPATEMTGIFQQQTTVTGKHLEEARPDLRVDAPSRSRSKATKSAKKPR